VGAFVLDIAAGPTDENAATRIAEVWPIFKEYRNYYDQKRLRRTAFVYPTRSSA